MFSIAQAERARDDDRRLVGEGHPGLERGLVLGGEERALVDVEPDPVAHAVAEVLAEPGVLDRAAAGGVDLARERARPARGASRLGRGEHHVVGVDELRARLAGDHRAPEVRAVAVDDAAEVEQHSRIGRQRVVALSRRSSRGSPRPCR